MKELYNIDISCKKINFCFRDTNLHPRAQFVDFAKLTKKHAQELYPSNSHVAGVVEKAWKDVGCLDSFLNQTNI